MRLKDKVIVVTGASGVIGQHIALACFKEGASVVLSSRSLSGLRDAEAFIRDRAGETSGKIFLAPADVADEASLKAMVELAENTAGPIYGLVCSAGVYGAIGSFGDLSLEEWRKGLETNLFGTLRTIKAALPGMRKRGTGRIVLFSGGGQGAMPRFSSYIAGKGALWRLTETLGAEFAEYGIYLNAMAPGPVKSKLLNEILEAGPENAGRERYEQSLKQNSEQGPPPEKAGELAVYLMSESGNGLYGKTLSALYDRYKEISEPSQLSHTDMFTMRRVVTPEGGTRYPENR